jgi:hypothetical protein
LAGVVIAVLGIAVLVVAFIALRHPKQASTVAGSDTRTSTPSVSTSASHSPTPTKSRTSSAASHSPSPSHSTKSTTLRTVPLIVLNDTTTPNLARDAAQRFEGGGWNVTTYDENFHNTISSTAAYYDPSVNGAKKAAEALQKQYPTIKRVVPRFAPATGGDPLPSGPVVVVLTSDYSPS